MTKKAPAKKAAVKKAVKKAAVIAGPNVVALTKAGVIPKRYTRLAPSEHTAIETLSPSEVAAIVATKTKLGNGFFKKHASHGMVY
jgi:hypothetical protein